MFDWFVFIIVGVESLPCVHIHSEFITICPWVRWFFLWLFWLSCWLWFSLLLLLWLLFLWFLLCLFLLWLSGHFVIFLGVELSFFFAHGDVTNNWFDSWLVHDSVEPSGYMWESRSEFSSENIFEGGLQSQTAGDISISDTFTNQKSLLRKNIIDETKSSLQVSFGIIHMSLVWLDNGECWPDPLGNRWEKGVFSESSPAKDISGSFATTGLSITNEMGDCGVITQGNVTRFKSWNLKLIYFIWSKTDQGSIW